MYVANVGQGMRVTDELFISIDERVNKIYSQYRAGFATEPFHAR